MQVAKSLNFVKQGVVALTDAKVGGACLKEGRGPFCWGEGGERGGGLGSF